MMIGSLNLSPPMLTWLATAARLFLLMVPSPVDGQGISPGRSNIIHFFANDTTESNPLNLNLQENATIRSQLTGLDLAVGAGQPNNYHVQYRDWNGADRAQVTNSANWVVTNDPGGAVGGLGNTWSALLRNNHVDNRTAFVS